MNFTFNTYVNIRELYSDVMKRELLVVLGVDQQQHTRGGKTSSALEIDVDVDAANPKDVDKNGFKLYEYTVKLRGQPKLINQARELLEPLTDFPERIKLHDVPHAGVAKESQVPSRCDCVVVWSQKEQCYIVTMLPWSKVTATLSASSVGRVSQLRTPDQKLHAAKLLLRQTDEGQQFRAGDAAEQAAAEKLRAAAADGGRPKAAATDRFDMSNYKMIFDRIDNAPVAEATEALREVSAKLMSKLAVGEPDEDPLVSHFFAYAVENHYVRAQLAKYEMHGVKLKLSNVIKNMAIVERDPHDGGRPFNERRPSVMVRDDIYLRCNGKDFKTTVFYVTGWSIKLHISRADEELMSLIRGEHLFDVTFDPKPTIARNERLQAAVPKGVNTFEYLLRDDANVGRNLGNIARMMMDADNDTASSIADDTTPSKANRGRGRGAAAAASRTSRGRYRKSAADFEFAEDEQYKSDVDSGSDEVVFEKPSSHARGRGGQSGAFVRRERGRGKAASSRHRGSADNDDSDDDDDDDDSASEISTNATSVRSKNGATDNDSFLTVLDEQQRAIAECIIRRPNEAQKFFIDGPPGTGKTETLCRTIAELLRVDATARILFVAPTQSACDVAMERMLRLLKPDPAENDIILRYNGRRRHPLDLRAFAHHLRFSNFPQRESVTYAQLTYEHKFDDGMIKNDAFFQHRVVVATSLQGSVVCDYGQFTHLFFDEIAQAALADCINVVTKFIGNASSSSKLIVFSGDERQLSPSVICPFVKDILGRASVSYFRKHLARMCLRSSHRASQGLCDLQSRMFYSGHLRFAGDKKQAKGITGFDSWSGHRGNPQHARFIHVAGGERAVDNSYSNKTECAVIENLCMSLIGELAIPQDEIVVFCAYVGQQKQILSKLQMLGMKNIKIRDINEFQGDESDVVIVSLVRNSEDEMLYKMKDFNTLVSRARHLVIVVGDGNMLRTASDRTVHDRFVRECVKLRSAEGATNNSDIHKNKFEPAENGTAFVDLDVSNFSIKINEFVPESMKAKANRRREVARAEIDENPTGFMVGHVVIEGDWREGKMLVRNRRVCGFDVKIDDHYNSGQARPYVFQGDLVAVVIDDNKARWEQVPFSEGRGVARPTYQHSATIPLEPQVTIRRAAETALLVDDFVQCVPSVLQGDMPPQLRPTGQMVCVLQRAADFRLEGEVSHDGGFFTPNDRRFPKLPFSGGASGSGSPGTPIACRMERNWGGEPFYEVFKTREQHIPSGFVGGDTIASLSPIGDLVPAVLTPTVHSLALVAQFQEAQNARRGLSTYAPAVNAATPATVGWYIRRHEVNHIVFGAVLPHHMWVVEYSDKFEFQAQMRGNCDRFNQAAPRLAHGQQEMAAVLVEVMVRLDQPAASPVCAVVTNVIEARLRLQQPTAAMHDWIVRIATQLREFEATAARRDGTGALLEEMLPAAVCDAVSVGAVLERWLNRAVAARLVSSFPTCALLSRQDINVTSSSAARAAASAIENATKMTKLREEAFVPRALSAEEGKSMFVAIGNVFPSAASNAPVYTTVASPCTSYHDVLVQRLLLASTLKAKYVEQGPLDERGTALWQQCYEPLLMSVHSHAHRRNSRLT